MTGAVTFWGPTGLILAYFLEIYHVMIRRWLEVAHWLVFIDPRSWASAPGSVQNEQLARMLSRAVIHQRPGGSRR